MAFTLNINTDYAAFTYEGTGEPQPSPELSRILRQLAEDLDEVDAIDIDGDSGTLRDYNGNTVGSWIYSTDRPTCREYGEQMCGTAQCVCEVTV